VQESEEKPFFVGYLDMPGKLKSFYKPLVLLMLCISLLFGYSIASMQQGISHGHWNTESAETITGLLMLEPYPVVHRIDPADPNQTESIILVRQGKLAAEEFAKPFHGQMVTLTGFPIKRGGWTMFEIAIAQDIQYEDAAADGLSTMLASRIRPISLGRVNLRGEVADSKCFLGVMKPGEGKVHRACAEVCILGGIPPMLLVRGSDSLKYGYLITESDGSSAAKILYPRSATSIDVAGEIVQKGDLLYIRALVHDGETSG
jgi:hypothetical protein